ncbi:Lrp/AsnC family transcriptional regulator [Streptomyces sp. NPDC021224]|uniref:Lrp/AsnC family transcriptional regulator n=1 Tax=unclassified Streptomyces TaxID=2593676 RepID=UPI0037B71ABC
MTTRESLDAIDSAIISLLQTDGRLTGAEVGRRVGLSQPAAAARIQRLERSGVITGYRAVVAPAALGLAIHAVVRLRTTHARLAQALALAEATSEVVSTLRLTGEDCLLLDIHCTHAERLEEIVDTLARHGAVTTSLVLRSYPPKPLPVRHPPEAADPGPLTAP